MITTKTHRKPIQCWFSGNVVVTCPYNIFIWAQVNIKSIQKGNFSLIVIRAVCYNQMNFSPLKSHWAQHLINHCSSGANEQWLMCCCYQKMSYLTHAFSLLFWALKNTLLLGLETRQEDENFRIFVEIYIAKLHVFKYFIMFVMKWYQ